MNPYGLMRIGFEYVHYITFFSLMALSLILLYRIRQPIAERLLSVAIYVCAAIMYLEVFWNIPWSFYYPHDFMFFLRDWMGFAITLTIMLWTPKTLNLYLDLEIPRVNWWRLLVLTLIQPFTLLWLHSTGFYLRLVPWHLEQTLEDPTNFQWAVFTVVALLGWIFIPKPLKKSN